jgi:ENTS family enterobactin (siderophore) exporter
MKEALRHVLGDTNLRVLFGLLVMASLTVNPAVMVTLQAHVKDGLGRTAGDAALPFALMGIGIAISSVVVMRKGDMKNKGAAFQRALICGSTITILTGRTTDFWQVLVLAFFMGLAGGFYINMNQGLIQANTPQPLMGRVMGLYALTSFGIMPFGALILGAIASWTSSGAAISGAALVSLLGVVTTYVSQRGLRELS